MQNILPCELDFTTPWSIWRSPKNRSTKYTLGEDRLLQKVQDITCRKLLEESGLLSISIKTHEIKALDKQRGKHSNYTLWIPKQHQRCTRLQVQGQQKFSQFQKCPIKRTAMESSSNSWVISVTDTFRTFTIYSMDGQLLNKDHHSFAGCTYTCFRSSFVFP